MYRRSFKSAEHVFQYRCAYEKGDDNLAEKIINSSHAGVAKRLAQDIHSEESFSKHEHKFPFQLSNAFAKSRNIRALYFYIFS